MGSRNLATYEYNGNNETTHGGNRALSRMTYGNGDFITYTYDHLGRVATETWDDGTEYVYFYFAEGKKRKKVDTATGSGVNYEYDTYDVGDDLLTYVDGNGFGDYAYTYDLLRRLETKYCWIYTQTFHYRNLSDSRTTTQIGRIDYAKRNGHDAFSDFSLAYEYDNLGNIKKVTGTNITGHDAQYTYDIQGQLTSETVNGVTYNYTYDTYGNIRSVQKGTEDPVAYTYGNAEWRDLLTAYDGETITYDGIGNPLSYYNGTRWTFEWEKGEIISELKMKGIIGSKKEEFFVSYSDFICRVKEKKVIALETLSHAKTDFDYKLLENFTTKTTVSFHGKIDYLYN